MTNYEYCRTQQYPASALDIRFNRNLSYRQGRKMTPVLWSHWVLVAPDVAMDFAKVGDLVRRKNAPNVFGIVTGYCQHLNGNDAAFDRVAVRWPTGLYVENVGIDELEVIVLPKEAVEALVSAYEQEEKQ